MSLSVCIYLAVSCCYCATYSPPYTHTQVSELGQYMNSSISRVNSLVNEARARIKAEVTQVYASMDQYIAATTAQFAAENDFVKYQLAGSFSLLACLICLYHVTSHLRYSGHSVSVR